MAPAKNTVLLTKSAHRLIEPGIIEMTVRDNEFFEVEDAEAAHQAHLSLSCGKKFSVLLDTQEGYFTVSSDAKKRIASKEFAVHMKASAFVVTSMASKLTGNFFIRFLNPPAPTRLFTSRQEALEWLRQF